MKTREEHMAWCKERALEYVDREEISNAFASMGSDLNKHPETKDHTGIELGVSLLMIGELTSSHEMRKFIEGFN